MGVLNAAAVGRAALDTQRTRFTQHKAEVAELPDGQYRNWTDTSATSGLSDNLRLDQIQTVATHNSYISRPNMVQNFLLGIGAPHRTAALQYAHPPLWDQLDAGVRSIELDVRVHTDGTFSISHAPVTANGGNSVDFLLALDEIALWSASHTGHLPISILLEFKADYAFLDWTLAEFEPEIFAALDDAISDRFGSSLMRPQALLGEANTLNDMALSHGWPTIGDTRGKVMFVMYPNEKYRALYEQRPLRDRTIFSSVDGLSQSADRDDVAFIIQDVPQATLIRELVTNGYIVRTRADTDLQISPDERDAALASGAQIVSTDFPGYAPQTATGYGVDFGADKFSRPRPAW
ncbi:Ca2+-dependent phosphoinositide-specific phospholipase C [Microbacterium sp. ZW T5_45]|uniref:Ca2+-dependent phosphoinositide-specific phospholipase C n=1 Tax=Microbacterium sp. ZW T5_45 TaxID=3378080 RepID=UPI0038544C67